MVLQYILPLRELYDKTFYVQCLSTVSSVSRDMVQMYYNLFVLSYILNKVPRSAKILSPVLFKDCESMLVGDFLPFWGP